MEKSFIHQRLLFQIVKISVFQMILAVVFVGIAMATPAKGQEMLDSKVTLVLNNVSLENALSEIEKTAHVKFSYNSRMLNLNQKVSVSEKNESLSTILNKMLKPLSIRYVVVSKKIVLRKEIGPKTGFLYENEESSKPQVLANVDWGVKGTVTDEKGEKLPGVSITIKGTTRGTTTNANGDYEISVADGKGILVFSYIGYKPQEVLIDNRTTIKVALVTDTKALEEVIVVGYGTIKKEKNITSVSTLEAEKITNLGASSVGETLGGRIPGIIVTNSGGGPGKKPSISLRGGGTPVYVIDDIISTEFQFQTLGVNDIENISFLKDGPATAIYGVAAGNGLVLVTTKRGNNKKLSINYNFGQDLSQPTYLPRKISSYELVSLVNQVDVKEGNQGRYAESDVQKYRDQTDPLNFPNNDWQKLVLKEFAPQQHHNLSLNGGNEQIKYYASLGYLNQGTLYQFNTNWLKRYNYRLSLTGDFAKIGLKTSMTIYGVDETRRDNASGYGSGYFAVWSHIQNAPPTDKAYADLERTKYANKGDHPIVEIDPRSGYVRNQDRNLNALLNLDWKVPGVEGLSFRANGNLSQVQAFGKSWNITAPQYAIGSSTPASSNQPNLSVSTTTGYNYVLQGFGNYERKFGSHNVSAMFGYEEAYGYNENFSTGRNSYVFGIDQIFAGPQSTAINNGSSFENVRNGWLGRVRYDFKEKYLFEGSFRYDGSDLFPAGKRKGFFPGAALGWLISHENFMGSLMEKNIINLLKARISYGSVGQNSGVSSFAYVPGYSTGSGYVVGGVLQPSLNAPSIPSPDISWYDQQSFNTGFDFATLGNKLSGSLDYFYLRTTGYLASPSGVGYTDPLGTALPTRKSNGAFRRAGFDFTVKYNNNIGKLKYTLGSNFVKFDQLWEVNPNEDSTTLKNPNTTSYHQIGFLQTAYLSAGLYQNSTDIMNSPRRMASIVAPGDIIYRDVNGDGKIDGDDFRRVGKSAFPRVTYGFTADLTYGGWFMNMLWQGSGKRSIYLGDVIQSNYSTNIRYEFQTKNHWEPGAGNSQFPRLISGAAVNGGHNAVTSDFWVINTGYLRLKALQVGYNFKNYLSKDLKFISDLRVTLSATNLLTFSKIKQYGLDPETGSNNNYDYPSQRVYALSVNLGF